MIVVDANVLVYSLIQMAQTAMAQQVAQRDPHWVMPPLCRFEFTSAVLTMMRGRSLTVAQGESALAEVERLTHGRELPVDQVLVLRTALAHGLSAYDAQYIALAQSLGVRCVTADKRVLRNVPAVAVSISDFIR